MVKKYKYKIIFLLIVLLTWEVVAKLNIFNQALLPTIESILYVFINELLSGKLVFAVYNSLMAIVQGLALSIFIALIFIVISTINDRFDELVDFITSIVHPIPGIAILPLVILWFGIGEKSILFVMVHSMLWPLIINMKAEIKRLRNKYSKIGKVFNFSITSEIINIYLYGSVPSIISGSKIAWSRGWRAYISAEMIFGVVGANSGLGWYLFEQRVYMNSPALYSGIIAIIFCGIFVEGFIFNRLEKMTDIKWKVL